MKLKTIEPKKLNEEEKNSVLEKLTDIAQDGFGTPISKEEVAMRTMDVDKLVIIYNDEPIGFSTYSIFPEIDMLYAHGTVIKQARQHQGIYTKMKKQLLDSLPHKYYALRTQNPLVYASTMKNVKDIYPNGKEIPEDIRLRAEFLAEHLEMAIDENFVERGTYGACLSDHVHFHPIATPIFRDKLKMDYNKGDSVLVIGR